MTTETSIQQDIGTTCDSKTYIKSTACGNIYMTVVYRNDEKDRIDYIRISGVAKTNKCGNSWFETISDCLTFMIRRIRNNHEAKAIIKNFRFHRCNHITPNKDHITSCADAIGQVLEEVLNERPDKTITG